MCLTYHCSDVQPVDFESVTGERLHDPPDTRHNQPFQNSDIGQIHRRTEVENHRHKMITRILQGGGGKGEGKEGLKEKKRDRGKKSKRED